MNLASTVKRVMSIVVFVSMVMSITGEVATEPKQILRSFSDSKVRAFNHLVVDKQTGHVYIGAVNRLYQLSPDLNLTIIEETGPRMDSDDCSPTECPHNVVVKRTDNVNKALVIDYATTRLIACGTISQGVCTVRNLHNISDGILEIKEAVVANKENASTVAFIGPGPPSPPKSQVMYVGVSYTLGSPYRSTVPAVSSRSLDKDRMLAIERNGVTGTKMFVSSLARETYPINYVYGFASEGFSYFITTQMKHTNSGPFISKLVRVCHDDGNYYSYTEIPLECNSDWQEGVQHNLVQAAYVGKAGRDLAMDLGITTKDDVLFAVFTVITNKTSDLSALCVYSMKAIKQKFLDNIKQCFSGKVERGLDFITPSNVCIPGVSALCKLLIYLLIC